MDNEHKELIRLPLWKAALDDMISQGISYGQTIPATWFEERLRTKRDTMQFGLAVSEIRRELEKRGFYLSGRGQNGSQFVIVPPENNVDVMLSYQRLAIDALKRGVILGTQTRLDTLADSDRRRHESVLEKLAVRSVLLARTKQVLRVVKNNAPNLLKAG